MVAFWGTPPNPRADRRTFLQGLVAAGVLAAGEVGRSARAAFEGHFPEIRLDVVPVRPGRSSGSNGSAGLLQEGVARLPFPATHVGLRWQGSEADLVELCWQVAGEWTPWRRLVIWEDACSPDEGVVAAGLVRPRPGATRLAVRWSTTASDLEAVVIDAGSGPTGGARVPVANRSAPSF